MEEKRIINSWEKNASAWAQCIEEGSIESRILVTNKAILESIIHTKPGSVLDLGCGEGWLLRAIKSELPHVKLCGIDAIPALIETAKKKNKGIDYQVFSYESIIDGKFKPGAPFDIIAINFALFGNEIVDNLLEAIHGFLAPGGHIIIQTLHPLSANGDLPYVDGWRPGSWKGFSEKFTDPAPWYFRTLQSWIMLLSNTGYTIKELKEPLHPISQQPLSVLFIASPE